ncbi:Glycosyl hydrolases family 43 [Roseateles sp. YR242]|uniref:glycoside hydrolase family 43 protein n=1 Tax=Roseateles sp. YR242 TaxID=1855305 RepID=UPI0008D392AB|nr:glycoside hydrolase family 43 protein [Roseateles sp. YR242]SEL36947.1 Glycosyl hydrolases family 43 [Roseateles sp. YR242]
MKSLITGACLALAALGVAGTATAANPLFPKLYTADPAALVDNGRVYLYTGHDEAAPDGKDFVMHEWRVFSSCDMVHWTDHGVPMKALDFRWAKGRAWASDITRRVVDGKPVYFFYTTVEHATIPGFAVGVATSASPTGPFKDARGSALITNDMTTQTNIAWDDIDPAVFVDDDGQAYLYFGNTVLKYVKLKPNMIELDGPIQTVTVKDFTEASYVHKHKDRYYLSYSQHFPEETAYMTGPSATGPWTPGGVIMEKNTGTPTIHQAIVAFNGKSYIFYHNAQLPGGGEFRRSVAVEELKYRADGRIEPVAQTEHGPASNPSAGCR